MKYLSKEPFSIFVTGYKHRPERFSVDNRFESKRAPKPGHAFVETMPGMCRECGLDRIGHREKWGKRGA